MGLKSFFKTLATPITVPIEKVGDGVGLVRVAHDAEKLLQIAREAGVHKEWYKSRTVWLNVTGAVVELVQHVGGLHVIPDEYVAYALLVGNTVLRLLTVSSVSKEQAIAVVSAAVNALPKEEGGK